MLNKVTKKLALMSLILIFIWMLGFFAFHYTITSYKIDKTTKTDAIIALTGGRNRIKEALSLFNDDMAGKLFISGVQKDVSLDEISQINAVSIKDRNNITIENKSNNTIENAEETNDWLVKNNIKTIRLVTSNYHIPRSVEEFKNQNKDVKIIINPVFSDKISIPCWENWRSFVLVFMEYNKFLFAYIKNLF